jgi:hypothetical protein
MRRRNTDDEQPYQQPHDKRTTTSRSTTTRHNNNDFMDSLFDFMCWFHNEAGAADVGQLGMAMYGVPLTGSAEKWKLVLQMAKETKLPECI